MVVLRGYSLLCALGTLLAVLGLTYVIPQISATFQSQPHTKPSALPLYHLSVQLLSFRVHSYYFCQIYILYMLYHCILYCR